MTQSCAGGRATTIRLRCDPLRPGTGSLAVPRWVPRWGRGGTAASSRPPRCPLSPTVPMHEHGKCAILEDFALRTAATVSLCAAPHCSAVRGGHGGIFGLFGDSHHRVPACCAPLRCHGRAVAHLGTPLWGQPALCPLRCAPLRCHGEGNAMQRHFGDSHPYTRVSPTANAPRAPVMAAPSTSCGQRPRAARAAPPTTSAPLWALARAACR